MKLNRKIHCRRNEVGETTCPMRVIVSVCECQCHAAVHISADDCRVSSTRVSGYHIREFSFLFPSLFIFKSPYLVDGATCISHLSIHCPISTHMCRYALLGETETLSRVCRSSFIFSFLQTIYTQEQSERRRRLRLWCVCLCCGDLSVAAVLITAL